jgi:phosphate:Na+ symporter
MAATSLSWNTWITSGSIAPIVTRSLRSATAPVGDSAFLGLVMHYLAQDWISAFLFAALIAIAFHSSVAAILVVAAIAAQGGIPPLLDVPLVLGINFGAALLPLYLARGSGHASRLVQIGNVILRGAGAVLALALQYALRLDPVLLELSPGATTVALHIGFNAVVAVVGLMLAPWLAAALDRALPPRASATDPLAERASALNDADLSRPPVALANAAREMMVICERTETMLARVFDLYRHPDPPALEALKRLDDEVDAITTRIKLYLTRLPQERLEPDEVRRMNGILIATIKLEQIADIITRNLVAKARKKGERGVDFSAEGWEELTAIHREVLLAARRAFAVLLSQDLDMARELVRSKERLRELHAASEASHLARLRAGEATSRQTSALHIDTIHDLKEINSLLVSLTYPVLEAAGMLRDSRLV